MKKTLFLLSCLVLLTAYLSGQSAYVEGDIHIHTDGNLTFFSNLECSPDGLLRNESGTLFVRASVSGENAIQLDENANLDVTNSRFTFSNEQNEKFNNLTLSPSGITEVISGNSLEISGELVNQNYNAADSLAGINLYADSVGYAQLLVSGTISSSGNVFAQQFLSSRSTPGWRELSSPVNTTVADVGEDFPLYFFDGANPNQWNIWWYDARPATDNSGADNPVSRQSTANAQYYKPAESGEAFNNQKAYSIYAGGPFFPVLSGNLLSVSGEPGNGTYEYDLYKTHDMGYSEPFAASLNVAPFDGDETKPTTLITGWNLIPNPYPCNINVEQLIDDMNLDYKAIHIWDAVNQQYFPITSDGSFPTINWNTDGPEITNNNIPPFQAFWVKANLFEFSPGALGGSSSIVSTFSLNDSYKTVEKGSSFFKRTPPFIALKIRNHDTTLTDQTIISIERGNDNGLDFQDAIKLQSPNKDVPTLSTIVEEHPLAINRVSTPEPGHAIPLSIVHKNENENFFIELAEFETDPNWTLHLHDLLTDKLHNFKEDGNYAFTHNANFSNGIRFTFYINYQKIENQIDGKVRVWSNNDGINVKFSTVTSSFAEVEIMDVSGRRFYFNRNVSTSQPFIWTRDSGQPMQYLIRVTTDDAHDIFRVIH